MNPQVSTQPSRSLRTRVVSLLAATAGALLSLSVPTVALADDAGFDASASAGTIKVVAHAGFHINKEYPWKVTVGDKKVGKDGFKFEGANAVVSGLPKGHAVLKGAVCKGPEGNSSECLPFSKELDL
ncbi:MAG: hypothetical protein ACLQVI_15635 [Polyangiaceae bacterium]|jgi:hypothetical protein